jgi:hypothetical protein
MKPQEYRNQYQSLRDSILIEIFKLIKTRPNWYMTVQDKDGDLIIQENPYEVIMSVTVKDFGDMGEKAVVWFGTYEEEEYVAIDTLKTELMICILEAMRKELFEE